MRMLTTGATPSAMANYWGPVQTAWGITSPKKRTAVTEMMTAQTEGTIRSRKIGRASMAAALERRRVTKSQ